jgi:glucose/arabinose dehydrogenase
MIARLFRVENYPALIPPPEGFRPRAPSGFTVSVFASGFQSPRWLAVGPNGAAFVADSAAGQVVVLQEDASHNAARERKVFANGLNLPFGIAFSENYVYVANTNGVVRFRFDPATSRRLGNAEHVMDLPGLGYNQHWTRSLALGPDGRKLFVSVGSESNIGIESDARRAAIISSDPDGKNATIYAGGLRNAVGIAVNPETGELWAVVNERDNLGDDVPSDYLTHVVEGGFYGWPYSYVGGNVDDRVSARPDLVKKAIVPDVLLGAHIAPLQFLFYEGTRFPAPYRNGAFIAEHGSWNRRERTGYNVTFVPFQHGRPVGPPTPFLTGWSTDPKRKEVYGRPVGIAMRPDGSLLVSDDGAKVIWQVSY